MKEIISTYQAVIEPVVDSTAWSKATKSISDRLQGIKSPLVTKKNLEANVKEAQKKLNWAKTDKGKAEAQLELDKANAALEKFSQSEEAAHLASARVVSGFSKAGVAVGGFTAAMAIAIKAAKTFADNSIGLGNKLISSNSIAVNSNVRGYMAKFGVSSTQASAMSSTLGITGYDISQVATWTDAQKKNYSKLMTMYQTSINNLDSAKLQKFTDSTQYFQAKIQEGQMKLQTKLMELFVNSNVDKILDHLTEGLDTIMNMLDSPIIQWGFDAIVTVLDWLTQFANAIATGISWLIGAPPQEAAETKLDNSVRTTTQTNNFYGVDANAVAEKLVYNSANAVG